MGRLSTLNAAACAADQPVVHFVDIDWPSIRLRYTDWPGLVTWGGNSWVGLGTLGMIGPVQESLDMVAFPQQYGMYIGDGVDDSLIAAAMTDRFQGKPITSYIGFFGDNGQLVDTPDVLCGHLLDNIDWNIPQGIFTVNCEYRLRKAPPTARMTDEDQKVRFAGDRYLDLIGRIAAYISKWGQVPQNFGTPPPPSGGGRGPPASQP